MSVTTVSIIVQPSEINAAIILSSSPVDSPSGEYGTHEITAEPEKAVILTGMLKCLRAYATIAPGNLVCNMVLQKHKPQDCEAMKF